MKVGAQLYTIRAYTQNEKDFARSMARISAMGYDTVQISAAGKMPAQTFRQICDDNGLKIALTHTDPERIRADYDNVMREHEIMGCRYIGMGAMPERYRNPDWLPYFAEDYLPACEAFKQNGMKLMYHNHNFEWERPDGGDTLFDRLLAGLDASLMGITLDTYWVRAAGDDLSKVIEKCKGRLQCVHYKDMQLVGYTQRFAAVGQGTIDFKPITEQLLRQGDTEYILVEQDDCFGQNPFSCLKASRDYIMKECF